VAPEPRARYRSVLRPLTSGWRSVDEGRGPLGRSQHAERRLTVTEARWRLALGLAQMLAAVAVPILWLAGANPAVLAAGFLVACALTAISVARWGGFWSGR
jgi:hypothetical protein